MWGDPNAFAYVALVSWIGVTLLCFARLRPSVAAMYAILGGALLLPERVEFNAPLVPPIDKSAIAVLSSLLGLWLWHRDRLAGSKAFRGTEHLVWLMFVGWVFTVLTNTDQIPYAGNLAQPMRPYDIPVGAIRALVWVWVPFFIGRVVFRDARALGDLLRIMVVCGLGYSLLALYELRMSPQLHLKFYGFYQHFFAQHVRAGGYRPMIFLTHGLVVAKFFMGCLICAAVLVRMKRRVFGIRAIVWVGYFLVMLLLCKSVGAILISLVSVPVILILSPAVQLRFAIAIGALVLVYPLARLTGSVPTDQIVELATEHINAERGRSLAGRFGQEDLRIGMLSERRWFGWGENARSSIFTPVTGVDPTTVDGEWLMVFGSRGIVGFLCWFGLCVFPIWSAWRRRRMLSPEELTAVAGLSVLCAVLALDLIPNSSGTYPQFFLAGVLSGTVTGMLLSHRRRRARLAGGRRSPSAGAEPALVPASHGSA